MKISKRQLRRIIREEKQRLFEMDINWDDIDPEDRRAMDMGIIPYPDGTYAQDDSDSIEEAEELIYYALRSAEDDIENRSIELEPGEFTKAVERVAKRFR